MRRAQITIFIILGLVIVIAVVGMLLFASSSQPEEAQAQVQENNLSAQACITSATRLALQGLQDDGVLSSDEAGPLDQNDRPFSYLLRSDVQEYPLGKANYYGLCGRDGPNGFSNPSTPQRFSCPTTIYAQNLPSVQEQLTYAVTAHMRDCMDIETGEAEIIIQKDALQVRYDQPQAQYSQRTPLVSVWAAIREVVRNEATDTDYLGYEEAVRGCPECEPIDIREDKIEIEGRFYNEYAFMDGEGIVASILLEDRGIFREDLYEGMFWLNDTFIEMPEQVVEQETTVRIYAPDGDTVSITPEPTSENRYAFSKHDTINTIYELTIDPDCQEDEEGVVETIPELTFSDEYANTIRTQPAGTQIICEPEEQA